MLQRQEKQQAGDSEKYYWDYLDEEGKCRATVYEIYHPTIPYEVYVKPSRKNKRVNSLKEAESFIDEVLKGESDG